MTEPRPMTCAQVEDIAGIYVLGALEDVEAAAVSAHLASCPEAHETFAELAAAGSSLALSVDPQDAPAGTRERVLQAISRTPQDAAAPSSPAGRTVRADEPAPSPSLWERVFGSGSDGGRLAWVGLAAAALAILFIGAGIVGTLQLRSDDIDRLELFRRGATAAADGTVPVAVLAGSDAAAGATGYAVFPDSGEPYIVIDGLTAAADGSTYQAWFIGEGDPVSAGLLEVSGGWPRSDRGSRPTIGHGGRGTHARGIARRRAADDEPHRRRRGEGGQCLRRRHPGAHDWADSAGRGIALVNLARQPSSGVTISRSNRSMARACASGSTSPKSSVS